MLSIGLCMTGIGSCFLFRLISSGNILGDLPLPVVELFLIRSAGRERHSLEAKKLGIRSIGIEANPMACLASRVKVDWTIDPDHLLEHAWMVAQSTAKQLRSRKAFSDLPAEATSLLLKDSLSPLPLHKTLVLLEQLPAQKQDRLHQHELLALAKSLVFSSSNLHFGPEVGVSRTKKEDAPVVESWLAEVRHIAEDVREVPRTRVSAIIHHADARHLSRVLQPNSIDIVFTSPPYPNEKDYTRTTRLESVILGLISNKAELQALKRNLLRSNTRNVYRGDDDDRWVAEHKEIQAIATTIEQRRVALGKTSGFEKLYGKVTKLYFGGMARHLADLRSFLKPGAQLGYVVGDQASYLQVMIRTGQILADIAQSLGYEIIGIDLFRTRFATATKKEMREEVVVLRWPGYGR
jgi:16S rRNA G966 N2-methylase RsmD